MTDYFFIHANSENGSGLSIKIPTYLKDNALNTIVRFFVTKGEVNCLYNKYYNSDFCPLFDGYLYNNLFQIGIESFRDLKFPAFSYTLNFSGNENEDDWYTTIDEIFYDWYIGTNLEKIIN